MGRQTGPKRPIPTAMQPSANSDRQAVRIEVGATPGNRSSDCGGHPSAAKGVPVCNPPPFDEAWASSLSRKERKQWKALCLEEYEATAKNLKKMGANPDPKKVRLARRVGEHHKAILRLLGFDKRMPVLGKPSRKKRSDNEQGHKSQNPS